MGKKVNTKAKAKKLERKQMEKKMNAGVANVKLANSQEVIIFVCFNTAYSFIAWYIKKI